jgi:ribonuclease HI
MALTVYSDGSSSGKSNAPGGYGWVIVREGQIVLAGFGGESRTTNNLMELRGAYEGLEAVARKGLRRPGEAVVLCSDSEYVLGFARGEMKARYNLEETARVTAAAKAVEATTRWVRGHGLKQGTRWEEADLDTLMNHRSDSLAKLGKQKITAEIANAKRADMDSV